MSNQETTSELGQVIEIQKREIEEYEKLLKILEGQLAKFKQFLAQDVKKEEVQDKVMDRDLTKLIAFFNDVDFMIEQIELSLKRFREQLSKLDPSLNEEFKHNKSMQHRLHDTATVVSDLARILGTFFQHLQQFKEWYKNFKRESIAKLQEIKKQEISATLENEKVVLEFINSMDQFLNSFSEHLKNLEKLFEEHKERLQRENKIVEDYDNIISEISRKFGQLDRIVKEFMNDYTSWLRNQKRFVIFILQKVNTQKKKEKELQRKANNQIAATQQNVQATPFTRTTINPSFNIDVVKMEQAKVVLKERISYLDKMIKAASNFEKHYNPFNFFIAYQKNFEAVYKNFVEWYQKNRNNFLATPDNVQYGRWLNNFERQMNLEYNRLEKQYYEIMNKLNQYLPKIPQNEDVDRVKEAMLYESLKKHNIDLQELKNLMESIYEKYNLDKKRLTGNVETFKFIFDKNILDKELKHRRELYNYINKELSTLRMRVKTLEYKKRQIEQEMKLVLKLQKEDTKN